MISKIITLGILILMVLQSQAQAKPNDKKMNVLFIAVDDLKPILGCYGNTLVKTPNIDKLAERGTVFMHNYCQQAVCAPTRASIMTGMRPDFTGVWDLKTLIRDVNPDVVTLPQYLISQGYSTQGIGKVFDSRSVDKNNDAPSWSVPYYKIPDDYFPKFTGAPESSYQDPKTKELIKKYKQEADSKGLKGKESNDYVSKFVKPAVECVDVPDNAYNDGANALFAKEILIGLSKKDQPFFFAVGFSKPHLPFVAPQKYWDIYKRDEMPLATYQKKAVNGPEIGYHTAAELYSYTDIPPIASFTDQKVGLDLPIHKQKELIHGYYAATSYTDAQVGILLKTLDSLNLSKNTIVILWGDHGWHLGDHNLWCKHTNFEQATRAPLLISAPGIKPSKTKSPTEFVDIFPTICELAGVPIPQDLDGKSLIPLMKNPLVRIKEYAVSQYPRTLNKLDTERLGWSDGQFMGYSIRTDQYRYTIWMKNSYRSNQRFSEELMVERELYDYQNDPDETVNVVADKMYASVSKELHQKMVQYLNEQSEKLSKLKKAK